jgi:hypothetical protein
MTMTTDELIEILKQSPGKMVVLSSDGEGNNFSPLSNTNESKYWPQSTWSGECVHPDDLVNGEYDQETIDNEMEDVVVLWPVN